MEDNKSLLELVVKYFKENIFIVTALTIFVGIFAGIFSLYNLEMEAVVYAGALCLLVGLCLTTIRFLGYLRRHQKLKRIKQDVVLHGSELPAVRGQLEQDYQEIINLLLEKNQTTYDSWQNQRNESMDYYTTWVHQIKTPIAAMKLVLQEQDTPLRQELLAELFRVEQYVEMVLCYFRLDSSSSDFIFREYSLDEIIRQSIRKYAGQFVRKRIRLDYQKTDQKVLTDEKWLCFILEQLLSNAVKYTEEGVVTISVDDNKVLTIEDTGIGIAKEDLPRIFEKGFTGYNGRADKKSTGLGLYLCKQAADKLSHRILVNAETRKGTRVSLDLSSYQLEVE